MTPKTVVRRWIAAFNAGDIEALVALYREDATHHQVAGTPAIGRDAIRGLFEAMFTGPAECAAENLVEEGEWAVLEWRDAQGARAAGFFHVIDAKIALLRGY